MTSPSPIDYVTPDTLAFQDYAHNLEPGELTDPSKLAKTIYDNFYHGAVEEAQAPTLDQMKSYSDDSLMAASAVRDIAQGGEIKYTPSLGWQAYLINGGYDTMKQVGRLYVNPRPEAVNSILVDLTERLFEIGVSVDIKAALAVNDDERIYLVHRAPDLKPEDLPQSDIDANDMTEIFNRTDKIVIYMNPEDAQKVVDTVSDLIVSESEKMIATAPRFTKSILSQDGTVVPGLGFAEEPRIQSRELQRELRPRSYGDFISKLLAKILTEEGPGSDLGIALDQQLELYNRNPKDPGLNSSTTFHLR